MKTLFRGAFGVAMLLAVASCGSDDDKSSDTTAPAVADSTAETTADTSTAETTAGTSTDETAAGADATVTPVTAGSGGSLQDQVADQTLTAASAAGITFDEDCVRTAASTLSDADAELILAAGPNGDPEVSPEGEATGASLLECVVGGPTQTT